MQLRIEKLVFPGKALARAEGEIIFTDEGLPGEPVEVKILKEKENYFEARTTNILISPAIVEKVTLQIRKHAGPVGPVKLADL